MFPNAAPILIWSSSDGFAAGLAQILRLGGARYVVFTSLNDLDNWGQRQWLCVLMDARRQNFAQALTDLRLHQIVREIPIIVLGADARGEMPGVQNVALAPMPLNFPELNLLVSASLQRRGAEGANTQLIRRAAYRHYCNEPSRFEAPMTIVDISEGGAQVECAFSLPKGVVIKLSLTALNPEMKNPLSFEVVDSGPCLPPSTGFRMNGKFVDVDGEMQRLLRRTMVKVQVAHVRKVSDLIHK